MIHIGYEQFDLAAAGTYSASAVLTIPGKATHCQIQSQDGDVNYTMDGTTEPSASAGMVLHGGLAPETFQISDLKRMKFAKSGGNPKLNVTYLAGRDI